MQADMRHRGGGVKGGGLEGRPADPLLQDFAIFLPERHSQYLSIDGSIDLLQLLIARGAFRIWDEARDHQNLWNDFQSLLCNALAHFFLQSSHLIQNVHNLHMYRMTKCAKSTLCNDACFQDTKLETGGATVAEAQHEPSPCSSSSCLCLLLGHGGTSTFFSFKNKK